MYWNLQKIKISPQKLFAILTPKLGRKKARQIAFSRNLHRPWKQQLVNEAFNGGYGLMVGESRNLKDIRILALFGVQLTPRQHVILENNKQRYEVVRENQNRNGR